MSPSPVAPMTPSSVTASRIESTQFYITLSDVSVNLALSVDSWISSHYCGLLYTKGMKCTLYNVALSTAEFIQCRIVRECVRCSTSRYCLDIRLEEPNKITKSSVS